MTTESENCRVCVHCGSGYLGDGQLLCPNCHEDQEGVSRGMLVVFFAIASAVAGLAVGAWLAHATFTPGQ